MNISQKTINVIFAVALILIAAHTFLIHHKHETAMDEGKKGAPAKTPESPTV